ncbi:MAG: DUF1735 domain-containing protein [Bacteroidales bacterium]|nr:DUF1735 domain-containing protein [Bacteroidales bacterium]
MNRIIKYSIFSLIAVFAFAGCADWITPERVITQHPDEQSPILRDNAYYEALRAYKKTRHKVAFGWYGSWTGNGASYQTRLVSAPDSMDIISIWSQWYDLTPDQIADKEYVQKVKGTKVTYTIFLDNLPEQFRCEGWPNVSEEEQDRCIETFAKAYCQDSMVKYNYDGIDIDYEPGFGASGPLVGNPAPDLFRRTIRAMSKYVGPKSGTGRLFMIDGVPYAVTGEDAELFDYGIVQAYNSSSYSDLQSRFNNAYNAGWTPEQYIFAENFESYWKDGGVNHRCSDGQVVNSLLGMARFNPTQGFAGGFGAYHMEYEYAHSDMPYKYMRRAIQDANPAGGYLTCSLTSSALEKQGFMLEDDGSISGEMSISVALNFSRPISEDVSFNLVLDESLVDEYNKKNGTEYIWPGASRVTLSPITAAEGALASEASRIGFDPKGLEIGDYLIPIVVEFPEDGIYQPEGGKLVKYVLARISQLGMDLSATALTGTKIEPTADWTITCYQGELMEGANGVWNLDSDAQKARMFDGLLDSNCWYASSASYSWANGGNFVIEMDKEYDINGFRWHIYYTDSNPEILDFLYSTDGKNWSSLMGGETFVPNLVDNWKIFQFTKTVKARYIRVLVGPVSSFTSMNEAEIYGPAN